MDGDGSMFQYKYYPCKAFMLVLVFRDVVTNSLNSSASSMAAVILALNSRTFQEALDNKFVTAFFNFEEVLANSISQHD